MKNEDKLRRVKTLMYKNRMSYHYYDKERFKKLLEDINKFDSQSHKDRVKELIEIHKLSDEIGLTETEIYNLWVDQMSEFYKNQSIYSRTPQKEGRDNKDVHVGTGGSNRNKIRYPSKKRSIKTWKKFYNLFPWAAEEDGWDGKHSSRTK